MYLAFYNLGDEPFRLTPDPRFLHLAEPHREALRVVLESILHRRGLVVMTGPVGTGKTTLLHTALDLLHSRPLPGVPVATAFLFHPTLSRDEFLEALLQELDVPCESPSKPRRLTALHAKLLGMQRRNGRTVLLIDEAHLLSIELLEEIRLLSNTDTHHEKLLQVILCGQRELLTLLGKPELRALQQRVANSCDLRPLSQAETRAYVAERLHAAQLNGPSPFSSESLRAVFAYSGGVPRLINLICDKCLSIGFRTQRKQIQPDIVEEAAGLLGLGQPSLPSAALVRPILNSAVDVLIQAMRQGRMVQGSGE